MTERDFLTASCYGQDPNKALLALSEFLNAQGFPDAARAVDVMRGKLDEHYTNLTTDVAVRVLEKVLSALKHR